MNRYPYQSASYRGKPPLTQQVPYLNQYTHYNHERGFGLLPFVGGLALGGLLFGGGCNGRPCGGGYYPPYPPAYYPPQTMPPIYPTPGYYPYPYQNQSFAQTQSMSNQATIVENNKFYMN